MTELEHFESYCRDPEIPDGACLDPKFSSVRQEVALIYWAARRLVDDCGAGESVNATIARLGAIESIQILEQRDFLKDTDYRCAEWTFGTYLQESWALQGFTVNHAPELWKDPMSFLTRQGYTVTANPAIGDVVAYGSIEDGKPWHEHFGVYCGDDLVVSKIWAGAGRCSQYTCYFSALG